MESGHVEEEAVALWLDGNGYLTMLTEANDSNVTKRIYPTKSEIKSALSFLNTSYPQSCQVLFFL